MSNGARFIPFSKTDIIRLCLDEGTLTPDESKLFNDVTALISSIFHFKFHSSLERLKESYVPINPDLDTKQLYPITENEKLLLETSLVSELKELLNAANFEEISQQDINIALQEESLFKIKLNVDFNDFEQILFFKRGESIRQETLSSWFGLRKKELSFVNFERVVIYVKYRNEDYFKQQKRKQLFFKPGSTIIKLFQNIPRADLEMLFPNTEVRMKTVDKLMIGIPALVGGIIMLATKLGTTLLLTWTLIAFWLNLHEEPVILDQTALIGLALGFGALGAFLWKQFSNFKNRKIHFMKTLADNLYFKNLDNNTGVFHRLVDAAEEEECKETILAYYFLLTANNGLDANALDHEIENWFQSKYHHSFDFEINDAIRKLVDLGLITQTANLFTAVPLREARQKLDQIWDTYFEFDH